MGDHAASIQAVAIRICSLSSTGAPLTGSNMTWIGDQFIKLSFTPEYESGEDLVQKNAAGGLCVVYKTKDVLKRVNLSLEWCNPEPEVEALLGGGDLLSTGGPSTIVGYASPQVGEVTTPNGVALELWSRAIVGGRPAAVNPYFRWVFPWNQMQRTGDRAAENGIMANVFEGYGVGNPLYAPSADGTWPFSTIKPFQYARTSVLPAVTNASS